MRIVLAIGVSDLRLAVELLLGEEPGVAVVGSASDTQGLLALIGSIRPDTALVDYDLPDKPIADVLGEIKSDEQAPKIIVLGKDAAQRDAALTSGADAYVLKGDPPEQLLASIRQHEVH
jgi:DNA-binding NarL/FixJ family response regulator